MTRILLVDDNPDNLLSMSVLLQDLDLELVTATSGKKALRLMLDEEFAFVLLDVNMPNMDGFEVAAMMKKLERLRDVPIVFLTAMLKDDEHLFRGYAVGAVDYIFTPIDSHILRAKVAAFAQLHRLREREKRHAEELAGLNWKLAQEVAEHKQAREALQESEARLQAILDNISAFISMKDKTGRYIFTNRAYRNTLHKSREEMYGLTDYDLFPQTVAEMWRANDRRVLDAGQAMTMEEVLEQEDGAHTYLSVRFPLKGQDGSPYALCSVNTDITDRKRYETSLSEKNDELERASRAKDRFLATMSHELRTPLNAIIGFTGTLLMKFSGPLTDEQEKQLRMVQGSGRHLLAIINDLLDIAKVEAGKIDLQIEPVILRNVIDEVAGTLRALAEKKGLKFEVGFPPSEVSILGDRRLMLQIILNLVSNAVKFTEEGTIRVGLNLREDEGHKLASIEVADTGPGISAADQEKLFQEFMQPKSRHNKESRGLGLYLSQKLAHLMRGRIELESEFGKGSLFRLLLPTANGEGRNAGAHVNH